MKGKCWKYGADINTDLIIPARYLNTTDHKELATHCMEDIDSDFTSKVKNGDIIIAEKNFGCGSSREHAPIAIKAAGISCVIAKSFARIFYRNAFNVGLPIITCPEAVQDVDTGDEIEIDTCTGKIINFTKNNAYQADPIPTFMQEIITSGGLMAYVAKRKKKS